MSFETVGRALFGARFPVHRKHRSEVLAKNDAELADLAQQTAFRSLGLPLRGA
jgi:hypothetical protein